ncbi:MAG: hypothetical protein VX438_07125, partial [Planctomycetota bacterium]|nr:hypothetical protein [Planctomycetota bacterium]
MRCATKAFVLLVFSIVSVLNEATLSQALSQDELITPDSEFVKAMVRPAVAYLKDHYKKKTDYGTDSLIGLAIFNAGLRLGKSKRQLKTDPTLVEILDRVSEEVLNATPEGERTIYAACVTGLLLAEVDEVKYQNHINHVLNFLYARQLSFGGWAYRKEIRADTSQTQYAALFLWLAKEKKFSVKRSAVEGAIN